MDSLMRNIRYSLRSLARQPALTTLVVLTLALSIGATSALFCAVDALLLQPLPFPDAQLLVRISQSVKGSPDANVSPARLEDWRQQSAAAFQALAGYYVEDVSETTGDLPERVRRASVSADFMRVWKLSPALGRSFTPEEYRTGGVVLISDHYWRTRFAADPEVTKRVIRVGDKTAAITGVMPRAVTFVDREVDLWTPVTADPRFIPRDAPWYVGIGRLKPGVSAEQGAADLRLIQDRLAEQYPNTDREVEIHVTPLKDSIVGSIRGSLWVMFAAAFVLLFIACANIAALLLARAVQREQEIAVCFSLGASAWAVAALVLTESTILAAAGATLGMLVAAAVIQVFHALAPDLPRIEELALTWHVVVFAALVALLVALACGLVPALRSTRMSRSLQSAGRTQVSSRRSPQWILVGAQVALSVTLLGSAGLLLRSFQQLMRVEPGFDPSRVLTFFVSGSYGELGAIDRMVQRINTTLDELRTVPGVEAAATTTVLPGIGATAQAQFTLERAERSSGDLAAELRIVSPSYFSALGIPLVEGELCARPVSSAKWLEAPEALVNQSFVRQYAAGRPPLGLHLGSASTPTPARIVGIVGDAREVRMDQAPGPTVYLCFSAPNPMPAYLVRTSADPMILAGSIRQKIKSLEPLRSVYDWSPLAKRIADASAQNRLRTLLLALFALAALAMSCLGIYGTLNYAVTLRQREVGLLLALGALRSRVVARFLLEALLVVGSACVVGVALLFASARVLSGMLFGVSATDPVTWLGVTGIVVAVGALAAALPAVRAALLNPMQTLRQE